MLIIVWRDSQILMKLVSNLLDLDWTNPRKRHFKTKK